MLTVKQEELANLFLSKLDKQAKLLYHEIISKLALLGYNANKEKSNLPFWYSLHNKQAAKISSKDHLLVAPAMAVTIVGVPSKRMSI